MRARTLWLLLVALLLSCGTTQRPPRASGPVTGRRPGAAPAPKAEFVFDLGEGVEDAAAAPRLQTPPATPLAPAAVARLLARLGPAPKDDSLAQDFALRERSLPPPRPGQTIKESFPPKVSPEGAPPAPGQPPVGPLTVLRHSPDGEVPLAPNLSVTFSQPMVAVTSHAEAAATVPVRLTPLPPGTWRWIGTRTLLFQPAGERFPMATEYRIEVPAGTPGAGGGTLAQGASYTFSTPPLTLVRSSPSGGSAKLEPTVFLEFDQKIDPAKLLEHVRLVAGGSPHKLQLLDAAAAKEDRDVGALVKGAQPGRWLAFRPVAPLPPATAVTVSVEKGAPSAEGPRLTPAPLEVRFETYGPLRIKEHRCGWRDQCPPYASWNLEMTNPLDPESFDPQMVTVSPKLPGMKAEVYGTNLSISGRSKGRTKYTVTLAPSLPDVHGQTLGHDESVTFKVDEASPILTAPRTGFAVLDPAGGPRFSVFTINYDSLNVRLYTVRPEQWRDWQEYLRDYRRHDTGREPPGKKAFDGKVAVRSEPDEMTETRIDLGPALTQGLGHVIAIVETPKPLIPIGRSRQQRLETWVQATKLGLDAFADQDRLVAWATDLADGKPAPGVQLEILPAGTRGQTGPDGLASIPLEDRTGELLIARRGGDSAILPENTSWWGGGRGWMRRKPETSLHLYSFDDRAMYKPGEEVHLKGWVRTLDPGLRGDVAAAPAGLSLSYKVYDSRRNEIGQGTLRLGPTGGFDLLLKLPKTMNLGHAWVDFTDGGVTHLRHGFQVQEFRRPEFEVTAQGSTGPHLLGGHATATVRAAYYAGGALPGADVTWRVSAAPGAFSPPNRDGFTFGTWTPWWSYHHFGRGDDAPASSVKSFTARTDPSGRHVLRVDLRSLTPPRPMSLRAEASVTDVNRQSWTATAMLLVHPAAHYVGLRTPRTFYRSGQAVPVDVILTDLDGKAVPGRPVAVRAERVDWVQERGTRREELRDRQDCALQSAAEPGHCTFQPKEGGTWRITATITDPEGRPNQSQLTVWIPGGRTLPDTEVKQEQVQLIPDRREYQPGDVAEILAIAPFAPAEGLMTVRRAGLVATERVRLDGPAYTFKVPIKDEHVPNVVVQVDLVGAAVRAGDDGLPDAKLPPRPAYASGSLGLPVPPRARTLALKVLPRAARLEPGGRTVVDVEVRDAAGQPAAGSDVAVVVVDEAILALTGYKIPDPVAVFYSARGAGVEDHHLRASVVLARPDNDSVKSQQEAAGRAKNEVGTKGGGQRGLFALRSPGAAPPPSPSAAKPMDAEERSKDKDGFAGKKGGEASAEPIRVRQDFNPLAVFVPSVTTDAQGRVQVPVKLPDNLTRYRVTAVAISGPRHFGAGESTITARLPLMLRPSPPRFLNFGDRFDLPIVLQNQTDGPLSVEIAVRAQNAQLTAGAGRRLTVPPNDRAEVRFPVATERAGTARFQVAAQTGTFADAADFNLPVWTPATTEAFATYGQIDQGAVAQAVKAPPGVFAQFGGLEITTSSTALQALTDAVLYIVAYPFECAEQIASRVMSIAALKDVLAAFQAKGLPPPGALIAAVTRDVERLRFLQNSNGGFGFWRRDEPEWPYLSIHVAHALQRARDKGFAVPPAMLEGSKGYLRNVERHIPSFYGPEARRALVAYALNVRQRLGDVDAARARALLKEEPVAKTSIETLGWLLPVLHADPAGRGEVPAILRHLQNRVSETAGAAHFTTSYGESAHLLLQSDRRADAVILEALITVEPKSDLIPKVVTGLLAHRVKGRWGNTQENTFVLLALDRYFNTYEKVTPDFVARAWLGDRYAGEHAFRGRTTERYHIDIPMAALLGGAPERNLVLQKQGPGRLYYRVGMQYAPTDLKLPPADHGFTVERVYEAVDKPAEVRRDADGTWRIKAGARVRVRLTMVAPARRYHVALVDPLPAGLEALNPALAVTGTVPQSPDDTRGAGGGRYGRWFWLWGPWYQHQNLRDERAEAFTPLLWEGVHAYSYVARATTPGTFVVPPPKAEEMYMPETFGRGAGDRVIVE
jgi:alpha-2-macroglobulin